MFVSVTHLYRIQSGTDIGGDYWKGACLIPFRCLNNKVMFLVHFQLCLENLLCVIVPTCLDYINNPLTRKQLLFWNFPNGARILQKLLNGTKTLEGMTPLHLPVDLSLHTVA